MIATIQAALASVAQSLPDAALRMSHCSCTGTVLAASSQDMTQEPVTADAPAERRRVVGSSADFPDLEKGSMVTLGDCWHIVTSARIDPVGASVTIGVSAAFDKTAAACYRGQSLLASFNVLAKESDVLDAWSDNIAPTTCRAWFVCVAADDWDDETEPQIGDEVRFEDALREIRVRVAAVGRHDGYYILTCRARR